MTTEINQNILDYLKVRTDYVTSDELSNELKVSKKTVSRHINSLNKKFPKPVIISKRGRGYKLDYTNYLDFANRSFLKDSSMRLRQENILTKLLFSSPSSVKINDLVNKLYVSESVLQNDEKEISNHIKKWDLKLERKQREIRIIGKEKNIRNALIQTVLHVDKSTDIGRLRQISKETNQYDFDFSLRQVEMALRFLNSSLPYPYNVNFFAHIYILLARARKYKSVDQSIANEPNMQDEIKKNPEIFSVCQKIVSNIKGYLKIDYPALDYEAYYLFGYLITSRLNSFDGIVLGDEKLAEKVTEDYIKSVSSNLNFAFEPAIKGDIQNHVLSMISRLKMNISLPNALLKDIQLEYSKVFEATKSASNHISKEYDLPAISDDENGFICLYFAKYYDQDKSERRIKAYVICTTGIGTSGIISAKIKKSIPEIEIVGLASNFNVNKVLKENPDVDLLISTVPIDGNYNIPVELVSAFFTKKDEQKVREIVKRIQNER